MSLSIDLSRNTGLVTVGMHTFQVTDLKEEPEGPSGHPYVLLTCACTDPGEDRDREAVLILSFSPKARFKIDEFLDAIEAPMTGKMDVASFRGKTFRATVTHGMHDGREQANLTRLVPVSKQAPTMPADVTPPTPAARPKPKEPADPFKK